VVTASVVGVDATFSVAALFAEIGGRHERSPAKPPQLRRQQKPLGASQVSERIVRDEGTSLITVNEARG
jgi:hypothetical protein